MYFKNFSQSVDHKAFFDGISSIFMLGIPPRSNFLETENDGERLKSDVANLKKDFSKAYEIIENEFAEKK